MSNCKLIIFKTTYLRKVWYISCSQGKGKITKNTNINSKQKIRNQNQNKQIDTNWYISDLVHALFLVET